MQSLMKSEEIECFLDEEIPIEWDRVQLEMAEARILAPSYFATVKKIGKPAAAVWLAKRIKQIERYYGHGFDQRVRGYMRKVADEELCGAE